jgi:hypothetical protein
MARTTPADFRRIRSALLGGAVWLGPVLWGTGAAMLSQAGDCGLCPPPYVHGQEQPLRIRFKGVSPKPVCPPCDEEFWGYYLTRWRRWPAPFSNCPERYPAWARVAPPGCPEQPSLFPPGGPPAPQIMPSANGKDAQPGVLGELPARSGLVPWPSRQAESRAATGPAL